MNFLSGNFKNGGAKNQRSRGGEGGYLKEFTSRNSGGFNIVLITHLLLSFVSVSEVTRNGSASKNSLQRAFHSTNSLRRAKGRVHSTNGLRRAFYSTKSFEE